MKKLIPVKYRKMLSKWLVDDETSTVNHKVIHYHTKSEIIRSEYKYFSSILSGKNGDFIYPEIKRKVVSEIIDRAIESGFILVENTENLMDRTSIIRAELIVVKPMKNQ
jgi:hypothetical protein